MWTHNLVHSSSSVCISISRKYPPTYIRLVPVGRKYVSLSTLNILNNEKINIRCTGVMLESADPALDLFEELAGVPGSIIRVYRRMTIVIANGRAARCP